ncbi:unc-112-related protein-like isoform X1 [Varroa jacobsoni]|uniref:PH domain-containing protein n=2 Tax=Varroa destructor TaxID=109461 RepID=A0A7M7M5Z6_VARDE|nr:unc-112-related protein-like isoform X1 [Varroa destructor]XP_022651914.1 unc-112-related protein-like isoform X1 [Varroa destructor]XP_022651923.1 unc-112-related protein-like isoform X1 [Varroa destructor]XP_022695365.1 unc-112-related protein-like isoform X1 [Varroa jacobsoni]XP_022695366.1 unc-112-related protein-like isoform X1 [Varroa jacobsoni]
MFANGVKIDGSWELRIFVTDLKVERKLRVMGDLHIGGVMLKLVDTLNVPNDWSDHALWWPEANKWLSRSRSTLDQYGVQADASLHFTPMHKVLKVQFPDLRILDCRVDYCVTAFSAVVKLCKELGIRHPEELGFSRPLSQDHLKKNYRHVGVPPRQRTIAGQGVLNLEKHGVPGTVFQQNGHDKTLLNSSLNSTTCSFNSSAYLESNYLAQYQHPLSLPFKPPNSIKAVQPRPKNLVERARLNSGWLDSSLSLMQQDVAEYDMLCLRFKYLSFYDLNPKRDAIRINQIYEQARRSLLQEEIDCTEAEMSLFGALQLQVNLQTASGNCPLSGNQAKEDDIDAALDDLQVSLEGSAINKDHTDAMQITQVPQLSSYLRFLKPREKDCCYRCCCCCCCCCCYPPRKFTLKAFQQRFFVFRDTTLSMYKSREAANSNGPAQLVLSLRGAEVAPDVDVAQAKYGVRLEVPSAEGMTEYWLRCEGEEQYSNWMAAFRLATKGKTMADASYEPEVKALQQFLKMQKPVTSPSIALQASSDIVVEDFSAPRFIRKRGAGCVQKGILLAHSNVKDLSLAEAKLQYIRAWQALPDFGITLFLVRFSQNPKKDEILGVAINRLMRVDLSAGDHLKTWRYTTMKAWDVNWEVKQLRLQFEEEDFQVSPLSADCKTIHEFIGGYIFLSMRSKEQNQALNEEQYHKLTGGWN